MHVYLVPLTLRGQAREELGSKTSQVQPVLSQICDYRPLSVNLEQSTSLAIL